MKIVLKNGVVIEDATAEAVRLVAHLHNLKTDNDIKVNAPITFKKTKKSKFGHRRWTPEEEQYLLSNRTNMTSKNIAKNLKRSTKAAELHLRRILSTQQIK